MNKYDQQNMADLYEEGIWDRIKASTSGIVSGVGGALKGQGYAKTNQAAQLKSLMGGKINELLKDIQNFKKDLIEYYRDPNSKAMKAKAEQLEKILKQFTK